MFKLRTSIVDGQLAARMRRAAAARASECGLQIWTLPQLAARLAGGFSTPLSPDHLDLISAVAAQTAVTVETVKAHYTTPEGRD